MSIVGIETEAPTSATCSPLALGLAPCLLSAVVTSRPALVVDLGNGLYACIQIGPSICRGSNAMRRTLGSHGKVDANTSEVSPSPHW